MKKVHVIHLEADEEGEGERDYHKSHGEAGEEPSADPDPGVRSLLD